MRRLLLLLFVSACNLSGFGEVAVDGTTSSLDAFAYDAGRVQPDMVYHFEVSSRDRGHVKSVALRVAAVDELQAFTIFPDEDRTALVRATIDPLTLSIGEAEQIRIDADLTREVALSLRAVPGAGYVVDERSVAVGHWPVTNHGFDFADLGFVLRYLTQPDEGVVFGMMSPIYRVFSAQMAYVGSLHLEPTGERAWGDEPARGYALRGDALGDDEGWLLVHATEGHILQMEVPMNYHPRFRGFFRYELSGLDTMDDATWEAFVDEATRAALEGTR